MRSLRQRILMVVAVLLVVFGLGTVGYMAFEGWSVLDALYMTAITLTTVGFGEVQPLSPAGRLFTIALIVLGVTSVAYGFSTIGEYLLTEGVAEQLRKRRTMRTINRLQEHVIICGSGRVGRTAAATLQEMDRDFVIVDNDPALQDVANENGWIFLEGDATQDEMLQSAGIAHAAGLLVCIGNDSDNLFVVLSARSLNADLFIVARSIDAANEAKMRRAGANKVISPYQIGGRHMANVVVRPQVTEFMDIVTLDTGLELWLEEVSIHEDSPLAGKTVVEADLRRKTGVTLVALLRGEDGLMLTPDENMHFEVGDDLIVLGSREQLSQLEKVAGNVVGHGRRR